jgi:hypothetical protein
MESKYYTPEIEEFHVGFEYETLEPIRDNSGRTSWNKWTIKNAPTRLAGIHNIYFEGKEEKIRVKHLDREDIESLGFEHYNGLIYRKAGTPYELIINFKRKVKDSITIRELIGDKWFELVVFPARNKSELRRILKQIGI